MAHLDWLPYCDCGHAATAHDASLDPICGASIVDERDFRLPCRCTGFVLDDASRTYADGRGETGVLGNWLADRGLA